MTSEADYVAHSWAKCPVCGSPRIESDEVYADENLAHAEVNCLLCGAKWEDEFTLTGMKVLDYGG